MDRATDHTSLDDLIPEASPQRVRVTQAAAGIACLAAIILGAVAGSSADGIRALLATMGLIAGGAALTLRPAQIQAWLIAAGIAALGIFAFPESWDSFRFLATVLTCLAAVGAGLIALPASLRYGILTVYFLFHFGGILVATTWPHPTPWITDQLGTRVYEPYLKFAYLKNAYHFYSPDPGHASHLYFMVRYEAANPETGATEVRNDWVTMPTRPEQVKDPLGLTYYRRLALAEQCSQTTPGAITPLTFEKSEAYLRRQQVENGLIIGYPRIPLAPPYLEPVELQYRVPHERITRYIMPSYVRHICHTYASNGKKPLSVKVYRLEHRILTQQLLQDRMNPYHPTTYRPYFLGTFDAQGELVDPQDPMLYWLVPILPKTGGEPGRDFEDYLARHAGVTLDWKYYQTRSGHAD